MHNRSKMTPLDEAVTFLRGHAATGTPVANPYYLFARDYELCCDEERHLRPDSHYGRMHKVAYNALYGSMENVKDLWNDQCEADAESVLIALLDRSYEGDTCIDDELVRDFVKCAMHWKPDSLEVYVQED